MRDRNPLNPEAGYVHLPDDPRLVEAALVAGRVSLRLVPYYGWRYGARGTAFTRSDSAWLAWLADHDQDRVDRQVGWLWGVLANRGMPGRLLELHLRILVHHLDRAVPERAALHHRLLVTADRLAADRVAALPEAAAEQVAVDLAEAVGCRQDPLVVGAGRMLADAVADERRGVDNAVASLASWIADPAALLDAPGLVDALRAPGPDLLAADGGRWVAAVGAAIADARSAGPLQRDRPLRIAPVLTTRPPSA